MHYLPLLSHEIVPEVTTSSVYSISERKVIWDHIANYETIWLVVNPCSVTIRMLFIILFNIPVFNLEAKLKPVRLKKKGKGHHNPFSHLKLKNIICVTVEAVKNFKWLWKCKAAWECIFSHVFIGLLP